jgi:MFS transporter, MFS domain-containing protein family, molybdate-anion transporter
MTSLLYGITFSVLATICALLAFVTKKDKSHKSADDDVTTPQSADSKYSEYPPEDAFENVEYVKFRNNYLLVYLCMMMADWLQGPYVYALYKSYGYGLEEIGILFVVGFLSSALFGTVISSFADKYGRKKMAILFSIIYTLSCLTKLSSNFMFLLLGRLFGGIATSLLFSVFEAWMVSEHNKRHFSPDLLSDTFSKATFGNGIVAIISGLLADGSVTLMSTLVAPFLLSALFLVAGGVIVYYSWCENYGEEPADSSNNDFTLWKALGLVLKDYRILCVGAIVSLFEGSMYTFVFLWGPVLEKGQTGTGILCFNLVDAIPFGLIFATFMVCIMIGSTIYNYAASRLRISAEKLSQRKGFYF